MMTGHQCCVLTTTEKTMENDIETVQKLLEVYYDAYKWFRANQDESIRMMARAIGKSEDIIRKAIITVNYPYPPYCDVINMRSLAQTLIEIGRITTVRNEDLSSFIESLYHPGLLEKISSTRQPAQ
jgi:hypothetical protein